MQNKVDSRVGKTIKRARELMSFTQEQLAREVGCAFSTVNRWENGRALPTAMAMTVLLQVFELHKVRTVQERVDGRVLPVGLAK